MNHDVQFGGSWPIRICVAVCFRWPPGHRIQLTRARLIQRLGLLHNPYGLLSSDSATCNRPPEVSLTASHAQPPDRRSASFMEINMLGTQQKEPRRFAVALHRSCDDFLEDLFHEEVGWATQGVVRILYESRRGVFRGVHQILRSGIRVKIPMHRMEWQIAVSMTMSASL